MAASGAHAGCAKYLELDALWASLEIGDVLLVRGAWLAQQCTAGVRPLPRRQELPPEACWEPRELIDRHRNPKAGRRPPNLVTVSYCWYSEQHPDPEGHQMRLLGRILSWSHACPYRSTETAVFIDWCSLYQEPRSTNQMKVFKRAMTHYINVWYAHALTDVLCLTHVPADVESCRPYHDRGWPTFEWRVSGLISQFRASGASGVFDLGNLSDEQLRAECTSESWKILRDACCAGIGPPATPGAFDEILDKKPFTKGKDDSEFCKGKYKEVFQETVSGAAELFYEELGWGNREIRELTRIFPLCESLLVLNLRGNEIRPLGARCLAQALPRSLSQLSLSDNHIGDQGAEALAQEIASERCPDLKLLNLEGTQIGDGCLELLSKALIACKCLEYLYLAHNCFHDADKKLSMAIRECLSLHFLDLQGNPLNDDAIDTLSHEWRKLGRDVEVLRLPAAVHMQGPATRSAQQRLRDTINRSKKVQDKLVSVVLGATQLHNQGLKGASSRVAVRVIQGQDPESVDYGHLIPVLLNQLAEHQDCAALAEAARAVRELARSPEGQERLAHAGVLPRLVGLLAGPAAVDACRALRSLVNEKDEIKRMAVCDGAVPALVELLSSRNLDLKENAAATLWRLSGGPDSSTHFLRLRVAPLLVDLLGTESCELQRPAVGVIRNLARRQSAAEELVRAGVAGPLTELLGRARDAVKVEILAALQQLEGVGAGGASFPAAPTPEPLPGLTDPLVAPCPQPQPNLTERLVAQLSPGCTRPVQESAVKLLRGRLVKSQEARAEAAACGAPAALAPLLASPAPLVQAAVAEALWLCEGRAPSMVEHAAGQVPRLVTLLRTEEASVQTLAARTLAEHTRGARELQLQAVEAGAVELLVGLLGRRAEELQLAASRALRHLALVRQGKARAHMARAVPLLLDLLGSRNVELLSEAVRVLRNLATNADVKTEAGGQAVPLLVRLLDSPIAEVQEAAAGCLRNFLHHSEENKLTAMEEKCLPALLKSLQAGAPPVQKQAVGALLNLIGHSDDIGLVKRIRREAVQARAIELLRDLLLADDGDLSKQADNALKYLAVAAQQAAGGSAASPARPAGPRRAGSPRLWQGAVRPAPPPGHEAEGARPAGSRQPSRSPRPTRSPRPHPGAGAPRPAGSPLPQMAVPAAPAGGHMGARGRRSSGWHTQLPPLAATAAGPPPLLLDPRSIVPEPLSGTWRPRSTGSPGFSAEAPGFAADAPQSPDRPQSATLLPGEVPREAPG